jgi:hypothetical protein
MSFDLWRQIFSKNQRCVDRLIMSLLNLTPALRRDAVTSKLSKIFQLYFAALFDWGCKGMCCFYSDKIFLLFFKSILPLLDFRKHERFSIFFYGGQRYNPLRLLPIIFI